MFVSATRMRGAPEHRVQALVAALEDAVAEGQRTRTPGPIQVYVLEEAAGEHLLLALWPSREAWLAFFETPAGRGFLPTLSAVLGEPWASVAEYETRWQAFPPFL